jgi:hypothetical protein
MTLRAEKRSISFQRLQRKKNNYMNLTSTIATKGKKKKRNKSYSIVVIFVLRNMRQLSKFQLKGADIRKGNKLVFHCLTAKDEEKVVRQTNIHTNKQTNKQTNKHTNKEADEQNKKENHLKRSNN